MCGFMGRLGKQEHCGSEPVAKDQALQRRKGQHYCTSTYNACISITQTYWSNAKAPQKVADLTATTSSSLSELF